MSNAMLEHFEIESIRKEVAQMPHFLTLKQVAEFLQVNYITVYRLVSAGEIDAVKVAGIWRIPREALLAFLERRHPFNWE